MAMVMPYSPPAQTSSNVQAVQSNPLLKEGDAGSLSNVSGINFIDMLVANFIAHEESITAKIQQPQALITPITAPTVAAVDVSTEESAPAQQQTISTPTKPNLNNQNPLALLQIALASQTTDTNGNVVISNPSQTTQTLETQLGFTNKIIGGLKNIVPENSQKEGILSVVLNKLQNKSTELQASLTALENGVITKNTPVDEIPSPLLIALGLSPSEISDITNNIKALQDKLGRDITVEDLITGVGNILPAPQNAVLAAVTIQPPKLLGTINSVTEPTDDLAAQLNNLDVGSGDEAANTNPFTSHKTKPVIDTLRDDSGQTQNARPTGQDGQTQQAPAQNKNDNTPKDNFKNLLNTNNIDSGNMAFPTSLFDGDINNPLFQQFGLAGSPSLTLGSVAQSANIISTSAMAGQAHPATNLVGAHILKYAANGNDQTMSIRLDPPELGHVNIRLKFGKDNSIKAHLVVEKPETFMMLSRDAHALERTLQQSGLDANASSISFELAGQNDNPFNNDGDGNDGNGLANGNNNSSSAIDDDSIKSSVMWQIDPSTGHVRYNLYV